MVWTPEDPNGSASYGLLWLGPLGTQTVNTLALLPMLMPMPMVRGYAYGLLPMDYACANGLCR